MTINKQKLAQNAGIMMISQIINWSIGILLTFFIPRYLGPDNLGKINLGNSLWAIVSVFSVFGMDTLLTKTIARTPGELNRLLSQSILTRISLFLLGTLGIVIYVNIIGYAQDTVVLIFIAGMPFLIGLINSGISASLQGLERMEFLAYTDILSKSLAALLIILAILLKLEVVKVALVMGIGATISFVILTIILVKIYPFRLELKIQPAQIKWLLTAGSAFFLLYIFITLYHQIDVVVISWLVNERGVGLYSSADKLVGTLMFIPTAFMVVFFPTFSRLHLEGPETLKKLFVKAINLMILLGIAIGFGIFAISGQIIGLLYGPNYVQSIPILSIRAITLVFTYLNIMMGMYLMSIDRQKAWIIVIGIATLATVPLDLIFVSLSQRLFGNGAMGGAMSSAITEFGMVIAAIFLIPAGILGKQSLWYAARVIIAGAGMVFCVSIIKSEFLLLQIIVGMITFSVLTLLFRLISPEDIAMIKQGIHKYRSKFRRAAAHPVP